MLCNAWLFPRVISKDFIRFPSLCLQVQIQHLKSKTSLPLTVFILTNCNPKNQKCYECSQSSFYLIKLQVCKKNRQRKGGNTKDNVLSTTAEEISVDVKKRENESCLVPVEHPQKCVLQSSSEKEEFNQSCIAAFPSHRNSETCSQAYLECNRHGEDSAISNVILILFILSVLFFSDRTIPKQIVLSCVQKPHNTCLLQSSIGERKNGNGLNSLVDWLFD